MHSQQSWDTVLPNSISSSLFSWSSLFQRQVQNNFLSFLFLSAFFARAKHWVHLKPWHRILPVEEITPLFLWMPLNLRCHKIASRTCFETVFPLPLLSVRITYSTFWGRKTWHFALLFDRYEEHTYEEIRQLDLVLHSDGNDKFFYITTWWDWIVWWSNILWNVNTSLHCSLEERGPQCLCPYHNAEHCKHPHCQESILSGSALQENTECM